MTMGLEISAQGASAEPARRHPIIDSDVHNQTFPGDPTLAAHLPARWLDYLRLMGVRNHGGGGLTPQQKPFAARLDSMPPGGGMPGSDPELAREQHLDRYGIDAAILNNIFGVSMAAGGPPAEFSLALARAYNEWTRERWLGSDPRWYSSIVLPVEQPAAAAAELARCREADSRFVQALIATQTQDPIGNQKYWPILEAAEHHDIPLAFHISSCRWSEGTGSGQFSYYYENHVDIMAHAFSIVSSLIFQGVFERFPRLKVVLVELGWTWAVPYAWRLDATWRVLHNEVPMLTQRPSEYMRDHFWYTSQPIEEPEDPRWFTDVWGLFERQGFADKLMFSSDYPHWDFDSPDEALPAWVSEDFRRRLFSANATSLYGIPIPTGPLAAPARA
jgi:hypothetical protein